MGSVRDFLKINTAPAHRKLDENRLVAGLSAGTLSIPEYRGMLNGYLEFFRPWETTVRQTFPAAVAELGEFRFVKSDWLVEDLAALEATPLTHVTELVIPEDRAGLAGCLYVIEGSTLGGMHLSRMGRGLPGDAGRFFRGYGQQTLPAWHSFVDWLEAQVFDEMDRSRAVEMAGWTFEWFERKFTTIVHDLDSKMAGGR